MAGDAVGSRSAEEVDELFHDLRGECAMKSHAEFARCRSECHPTREGLVETA